MAYLLRKCIDSTSAGGCCCRHSVVPSRRQRTWRVDQGPPPKRQILRCAQDDKKARPEACSRLVALDVVILDHLEPALLLDLLIGGERLGRAGQDLHVELL